MEGKVDIILTFGQIADIEEHMAQLYCAENWGTIKEEDSYVE